MTKNKKYIEWLVLNCVGFVLFALIFVFMFLDFHGQWGYNLDDGTAVTGSNSGQSFYKFAIDVTGNFTADTCILFFVMLLLFLIWSIVSFVLYIVGNKRIHPYVLKTLTFALSFFVFALIMTIAIKMAVLVDLGYSLGIRHYVGYWLILFTTLALIVTQVASACLLHGPDKAAA